MFKFYGLMVLVPLAFMAYRARGWRGWLAPDTLLACVALVTPVLAWTTLAFARTPNPASSKCYFLWQMPELLAERAIYTRLFDRLAYKSCGPVTGVLMAAGAAAVLARRARIGPAVGWTVAGLLFFFLMAPLLRRHDYYELMLLPAASLWAAAGWQQLAAFRPPRGARVGAAVLAAALVIHSPFVIGGQFEIDRGLLVIAGRMEELCAPGERFVIAGPLDGVDVIHCSGREGWAWTDRPIAADWQRQVQRYREFGARYLVVYDNGEMPPEVLAGYRAMLQELPLIESRAGPWLTHGRTGRYWLLGL